MKMIQVNLRKAIFLYLIIYIALSSLTVFYLSQTTENRYYDSSFFVGDSLGFDLNKSALTFGMITPGGATSSRGILLNNTEYDRKVEVYVEGNISKYLYVDKQNFILEKNENKNLPFFVKVPEGTEFGEYNGNVKLKITKLKLFSNEF